MSLTVNFFDAPLEFCRSLVVIHIKRKFPTVNDFLTVIRIRPYPRHYNTTGV